MRSKDKVRIFIFKNGAEAYHVRVIVPGEVTKEFSVDGTLYDVEHQLLKIAQEADEENADQILEAVGLMENSFEIKKLVSAGRPIHITRDALSVEPDDMSAWCEKEITDGVFSFISIEQALDVSLDTPDLKLCDNCLSAVMDSLNFIFYRNMET